MNVVVEENGRNFGHGSFALPCVSPPLSPGEERVLLNKNSILRSLTDLFSDEDAPVEEFASLLHTLHAAKHKKMLARVKAEVVKGHSSDSHFSWADDDDKTQHRRSINDDAGNCDNNNDELQSIAEARARRRDKRRHSAPTAPMRSFSGARRQSATPPRRPNRNDNDIAPLVRSRSAGRSATPPRRPTRENNFSSPTRSSSADKRRSATPPRRPVREGSMKKQGSVRLRAIVTKNGGRWDSEGRGGDTVDKETSSTSDSSPTPAPVRPPRKKQEMAPGRSESAPRTFGRRASSPHMKGRSKSPSGRSRRKVDNFVKSASFRIRGDELKNLDPQERIQREIQRVLEDEEKLHRSCPQFVEEELPQETNNRLNSSLPHFDSRQFVAQNSGSEEFRNCFVVKKKSGATITVRRKSSGKLKGVIRVPAGLVLAAADIGSDNGDQQKSNETTKSITGEKKKSLTPVKRRRERNASVSSPSPSRPSSPHRIISV